MSLEVRQFSALAIETENSRRPSPNKGTFLFRFRNGLVEFIEVISGSFSTT
jgi:hypothetical protein